MLPPSFVATSRQQPQGVPTYSYPITGASGEFYSLLIPYGLSVPTRTSRFLLAAPGSFSRSRHTSFPPTARSLRIPEHRYSSLSKLSTLCCCILASFRVITCSFSNVKDLSSQYYHATKQKALLTMFRYIVWLKATHENSYCPLYTKRMKPITVSTIPSKSRRVNDESATRRSIRSNTKPQIGKAKAVKAIVVRLEADNPTT